jgi:uncharacterized protein (DUF169 family)
MMMFLNAAWSRQDKRHKWQPENSEGERDMVTKLKIPQDLGVIGTNAQYSIRLQKILELNSSPVAVAISLGSPDGLEYLQQKATACMMVQIARNGTAFCSSGDSIICGGRASLGVGESPIQKLDEFLVHKEKLFSSKAAALRLLDSIKRHAPNQGSYLAFSPLEKATFFPDVVLFIGTPAQLSRIIFLDAFETGEIDTIHGEPLCSGAIAMPITTGRIGISFMDTACRLLGRYKPEEMAVGVPYQKLSRIVDNIGLSSAGKAKPDLFLRLAGSLLRRRVPVNSRYREDEDNDGH